MGYALQPKGVIRFQFPHTPIRAFFILKSIPQGIIPSHSSVLAWSLGIHRERPLTPKIDRATCSFLEFIS